MKNKNKKKNKRMITNEDFDREVRKLHERLSGLYGNKLDRITDDDIANWVNSLCKLSTMHIDIPQAVQIASSKISYQKEKIEEIERNYVREKLYGNQKDTYMIRSENGIVHLLMTNPLMPLQSSQHADNVVGSYHRHKDTDYEYRLAEGRRLAYQSYKNSGKKIDPREYAKSNKMELKDVEKLLLVKHYQGFGIYRNSSDCIYRFGNIDDEFMEISEIGKFYVFSLFPIKEELSTARKFCNEEAQKKVGEVNAFLFQNYPKDKIPPLNEREQELLASQISDLYYSTLIHEINNPKN